MIAWRTYRLDPGDGKLDLGDVGGVLPVVAGVVIPFPAGAGDAIAVLPDPGEHGPVGLVDRLKWAMMERAGHSFNPWQLFHLNGAVRPQQARRGDGGLGIDRFFLLGVPDRNPGSRLDSVTVDVSPQLIEQPADSRVVAEPGAKR